MGLIEFLVDVALNFDDYLITIVHNYEDWTYLILFLIIFLETGFLIAAFLPGDALLITTGTIAAVGGLNVWFLMLILFIAAFLGDCLNYEIGKRLGYRIFELDSRFIKRKHLIQTQHFYEKHGGKTIVLARFIPVVRTFAPFIAGISEMKYSKFLFYNISGAFVWVVGCILLGYFFGNLPYVKEHFSYFILGIAILSICPVLINYLLSLKSKKTIIIQHGN